MWSLLREGLCGKLYTLNFDGSHNNQNNKSGAGCIIRDNQGEFKLAAAYCLTESYPDCNVAIAEALALLNGLKLAKENNLNINIIRGDSTEVIDHVLNRNRRPAKAPLSQIINQITGLIDCFSQTIEVVHRDANKVADKLAYWGSSRLLGGRKLYTTYADLPPQVAEFIEQDKSCNKMKEVNNGEGSSSMASNIGMGVAAIAGIGLALGVSKLFNDTSSDDQQYQKNTKKAPWSYVMDAYDTQNYASKTSQMGSSNLLLLESSYDGYDHQKYATKCSRINDFYTLNFDGSDINQLKKGGAGCIIRNREKDLVIAAAYNLDNLDPSKFNVAIAEAIALRNGLKMAKNNNIKLDIIEGDSKEVIDRVLGQERKPPRIPFLDEIIGEIRVALFNQSIHPQTQLRLIEREDNRVADELATIGSKLGYGMEKTYAKDDVLTFKMDQLIKKDKLAMGVSKQSSLQDATKYYM